MPCNTHVSRKKCGRDYTMKEFFLSLVDYRNSLFTSNNPDNIIRFYDSFQSRDDLIEWMKERPKGAANILEVDGEKEVIVVIPTADFNGKYAKECRENIFKGLHIIFVESGENGDHYFNYAHNCNIGIKKALEYNPKWIIISNDDMYKIDEIDILKRELKNIDPNRVKTVFTQASKYHSYNIDIGKLRTNLYSIYNYLFNRKDLMLFKVKIKLIKFYNVKYWNIGNHFGNNLLNKFFFKKIISFILTGSFTILSAKWCSELNGNVFNETYINGFEDVELSLELNRNKDNIAFINYKIGDLIGSTLGNFHLMRILRDYSNLVYFNHRVAHLLKVKIRDI